VRPAIAIVMGMAGAVLHFLADSAGCTRQGAPSGRLFLLCDRGYRQGLAGHGI